MVIIFNQTNTKLFGGISNTTFPALYSVDVHKCGLNKMTVLSSGGKVVRYFKAGLVITWTFGVILTDRR